jgi:hypothetical protein
MAVLTPPPSPLEGEGGEGGGSEFGVSKPNTPNSELNYSELII